jgi:hypothetical protein
MIGYYGGALLRGLLTMLSPYETISSLDNLLQFESLIIKPSLPMQTNADTPKVLDGNTENIVVLP